MPNHKGRIRKFTKEIECYHCSGSGFVPCSCSEGCIDCEYELEKICIICKGSGTILKGKGNFKPYEDELEIEYD